MRERDIEKYLKMRVTDAGGEIRKVRWIGRNGAPDRRIMLRGYCAWVELKAPGEVPTLQQQREHSRMRQHGEVVWVIDSLEGVDTLIERARGPIRA